jgi:SMP-30/gluconolaconase/LRE-like protein
MRFPRRALGLAAAGLLLAGGTGASREDHPAPGALSILSSGELVILDLRLGLFRFTPDPGKPASGKLSRLVTGFGLYEGTDLQVARIGGEEAIFVSQASLASLGARLMWLNLQGKEKGSWFLPPWKGGSCTGVAVDAGALVAYVASPQTGEIFKFDLRSPRTSFRPLARISQESALGAMVLDSKRRRLLVADALLGSLYAVDLDTGKSTRLAKSLGEPSALALDAKTDELFVADASGRRLWRLPLTGSDVEPQVLVKPKEFQEPRGLALGDDGSLWVGDTSRQRLFQLSREGKILRSIKL